MNEFYCKYVWTNSTVSMRWLQTLVQIQLQKEITKAKLQINYKVQEL